MSAIFRRARLLLAVPGVWAVGVACGSDPTEVDGRVAAGGSGSSSPTAGETGGGRAQAGGSSSRAGASAGAEVAEGGSAGTSTGAGDAGSGRAIGAAEFAAGELDAVSDGGTLTFRNLGQAGAYPSRRDPASGMCDRYSSGACCMTAKAVESDKLTPWDEEVIVTLRGPLQVKQLVVYTPRDSDDADWQVQSAWDARAPEESFGIAFHGDATKGAPFTGTVGSECLADVMTDRAFPCGPGSVPYCPAGAGPKNYGWAGSKLFVLTARMPMQDGPHVVAQSACGSGTSNNWYNAPWIGVSLGELVREGKFSDCNCYGRTPVDWYAGDGCGQINAFEVVNDNNEYQNFDVLSSNVFAYYGYVGEGPCGKGCNLAGTGPADLIDKATSLPASEGAVTTFGGSAAHAAFRRPSEGYRYVLLLFDVETRQLQLAIIHPRRVPAAASALLPTLPRSISRATIDGLLALRLPQ